MPHLLFLGLEILFGVRAGDNLTWHPLHDQEREDGASVHLGLAFLPLLLFQSDDFIFRFDQAAEVRV